MDWQTLVVAPAVALAVWYLGRRAWRTWAGTGGGCGSCSCTRAPAPAATRVTLIPPEQLTLRRRDS